MKRAIVVVLVLLISACATDAPGKTNCLRRVAASEITVTESYQTTTTLYVENILSKDKAKAALKAINAANAAVDSAGRFCHIDQPRAADYLAEASKLLLQASQIQGSR